MVRAKAPETDSARTLTPGRSGATAAITASPPPSGRCTSRSTTSGSRSRIRGTASATLPAERAVASGRTFTFYGAGWGHGVGLSQWGAYGLARKGWGDERILRHYYAGTRVLRTSHPPAVIRVGIAQWLQAVHLHADRGTVKIRRKFPFGEDTVMAHFSLAGRQLHREHELPIQERTAPVAD